MDYRSRRTPFPATDTLKINKKILLDNGTGDTGTLDINTGQTIKFNQNVYLATNLYFNSENALIYVSDGSGSYNSTNIIPENLNQSVIFPTLTEINVECRSKKLGVANVSIPGPQSIESLTLTNFENRGKYLLELAPVGGIILTIRGQASQTILLIKKLMQFWGIQVLLPLLMFLIILFILELPQLQHRIKFTIWLMLVVGF